MGQVKPHKGVFLFLLLVLGFIFGATTESCYHEVKMMEKWSRYENLLTEYDVEKNKTSSLSSAIHRLETENNDLKALLAELKERPAEIKYITKIETKVLPGQERIVTSDLPDEHLFRVGNYIVVGRFSKQNNTYVFDHYDVKFKSMVVIGEDKSAATLQLASSYDDFQWVEIPIDLQVSETREQRLVEPHIGIGITASSTLNPITGSLFVSTIHPRKDLDLLSLRAGFNDQLFRAGIDAIGYNVGQPLPVLTDTWIYAGGSLDTRGTPSVDLTLGSKF